MSGAYLMMCGRTESGERWLDEYLGPWKLNSDPVRDHREEGVSRETALGGCIWTEDGRSLRIESLGAFCPIHQRPHWDQSQV